MGRAPDDKLTYGSPEDHRLLLTAAAFDTAQHAWRVGRLGGGPVELIPGDDDIVVMRLAGAGGPELRFTRAEIDAFLDGVTHHEFDAAAYAKARARRTAVKKKAEICTTTR